MFRICSLSTASCLAIIYLTHATLSFTFGFKEIAMTDLHDPIFTDDTKAREYLEAQRWPDAVSCAQARRMVRTSSGDSSAQT